MVKKNLFSYQNILKPCFQSYFYQKEKMKKKKWHFLFKSMGYPLWKNAIYGTVIIFSIVKKSFLSIQNILKPYFQSYFKQKQIMKKLAFFDQNYGLTPFGKIRFLRSQKLFFLQSEKVSFLSGTLLNLVSSLNLSKNK